MTTVTPMKPDIHARVVNALQNDYKFKTSSCGKWMNQGRCPKCGKNDLMTSYENPWSVRCGRETKCDEFFKVRDIYKDIFEDWTKRAPATVENPNATAEAFMRDRGLNTAKLDYVQENHYKRDIQVGTPTVRFYVDKARNIAWERFIENTAKLGCKANFIGAYGGLWWQPPRMDINDGDTVVICEGVFDAAAVWQMGFKAVTPLTCNVYPEKALAALRTKRLHFVFAYDNDKAGKKHIKSHVERMRDEIEKHHLNWEVSAAMATAKDNDWNNTLQRLQGKALINADNKEAIELYQVDEGEVKKLFKAEWQSAEYRGALLIAKNAHDKGLLMYNHDSKRQFPFDHNNRLYWFQLDVDKFHKILERLETEAEKKAEKEGGEIDPEALRDQALVESGSINTIANCYPQFLYFQSNPVTDESWYYLRVNFPHKGGAIKNTFTGSQISSAAEFKKRLISVAPGAMFTGTSAHLDSILEHRVFNIKNVQTIDYTGYSKEHSVYVYRDIAVRAGHVYELNDEDYFDLDKLAIKSLNRSAGLAINTKEADYNSEWVQLVWDCFGPKGLAAVAFWLGTLFAEQIRANHESFPFLELIGEPGAGKTTIFEFLWKLVGRTDYEGFDPSNSTIAAIARILTQVSNLPVVFLEGDRDDARSKSFDWNQIKTLYNGRSPRARGQKNGGNETYEPPFRGAVVITQNQPVDADEAILQRIVHIKFTREKHGDDTRLKAEKLARIDVDTVSGFLLQAITKEKQLMETFDANCKGYEAELMKNPQIKTVRIAKTHGQMQALVDCLAEVIDLSEDQVSKTLQQVSEMAVERQQAIGSDHPQVALFWETYEFLNGCTESPNLNHSRKPLAEIAINLNHIYGVAAEKRQELPLMREMKRLLKDGRRYKFVKIGSVNSGIYKKPDGSDRTMKCWIFKDTQPDAPTVNT